MQEDKSESGDVQIPIRERPSIVRRNQRHREPYDRAVEVNAIIASNSDVRFASVAVILSQSRQTSAYGQKRVAHRICIAVYQVQLLFPPLDRIQDQFPWILSSEWAIFHGIRSLRFSTTAHKDSHILSTNRCVSFQEPITFLPDKVPKDLWFRLGLSLFLPPILYCRFIFRGILGIDLVKYVPDGS